MADCFFSGNLPSACLHLENKNTLNSSKAINLVG